MKTTFSIKSMLLAATLSVVGTASAPAETIIFLNAKPDIIGTSTFVGHEGEIILSGFSANIAVNTTATSPGSAAQRTPPVCGRFTIIKRVDQTSPQFIKLVLEGQHLFTATITFANRTGDGLVTFATINLRELVVTSITQNEPEPDATAFSETIALQAAAFIYSVDTASFGWNCAARAPF
jgi:type VI secretion system Hcp family effector